LRDKAGSCRAAFREYRSGANSSKAFPDQLLLINIKSNDPAEGRRLAEDLGKLPKARRGNLMAYGGDQPIAALRQALPDLRTMSRATLRSCCLQYVAVGWTGYMPSPCQNSVLLVPMNVGPWMWGWPNRFQRRLSKVNSVFFVVAPYHGGGFSQGIDGEEALRRLPEGFVGGISTDQIDTVAGLLQRNGQ